MTDAVLHDAHVLVIGGTGTIGGAIVGHAASAGARVTLTSRDGARAEEAASGYDEGVGGPVTGVAFDVTDHAAVEGLVAHGPFDHVVITAADNSFKGLSEITAEELDAIIATKLTGIMWTARHLRSHVDDRGSMLFISGMLSRRPTMAAPLAAVNAAVEALAVGLAHEWSPLRVNAVSPGGLGQTGAGGHAGAPGDVAALVTSVLANRWINGTVLDIHGG